MQLAYITAITLLAFGLRWLPRRILPNAILSDAYFHLFMAREIRRARVIPDEVSRTLISPSYTYPFLYHLMLAFLPERAAGKAERVSSACFDAVHVVMAYFLGVRMLPYLGLTGAQVEYLALLAALLVAVHPSLLLIGSGPRAYSGSPRPLGQLVFVTYLGSTAMYMLEPLPFWLVLGIGGAALMPIASKFGNQAVGFFALGLAICGYLEPLAVAAGGFAISILLTRGRAWRVLKGQIAHSHFYFRYLQKRYLYPNYRSPASYLRAFPGNLLSAARSPGLFFQWLVTERFFLHRVLVCFPHMLLAFALVAFSPAGALLENPAIRLLALIGAIGLCLGLLTSAKPLLFLGEPERYLEHTVLFQVLLCLAAATFVGWTTIAVIALIVYSLAVYLQSVVLFVKSFRPWQEVGNDVRHVLLSIDRPNRTVMAVGGLFWVILYHSDHLRLYFHGGNLDAASIDIAKWEQAFGNFPFPGLTLSELHRICGVDYVVGFRSELAHYGKLIGDPGFLDNSVSRQIATSGQVVALAVAETA